MGLIKDEDVCRAKSIDLKSFLEYEGFSFVKESEYGYRSKEEHTLVITYKYGTPIYFWYNKGQKGKIVEYVMCNITGNNFRGAIDYLLNGGVDVTSSTENYNKGSLESKIGNINIEYSSNKKRMFSYLNRTRAIKGTIINDFISKGLLGEDQLHNVLFLHLNESDKIIGADKCGTNSFSNVKFKGVVAGSNQNYGFSLKIGTELKKILVFEAPIDLLSFYQMNQCCLDNCLLLSTGGSSKVKVIKTYLNIYKSVDTICVCTDNDSAGDEAYENIKKLYDNYSIVDGRGELLSTGCNDFNDLLLKE